MVLTMQTDRLRRRQVLVAGLAIAGPLAGCAGGQSDGRSDDSTPTATPSEGTDGPRTESPDPTPPSTGTATAGLDLREANVVGVTLEGREGAIDFEVTLHHDDDGEEGYADWWQVESLDGTRLGRRDLLHPHSSQPFTRSASIDVAGADCVVVRGHDQTHGYGGQAMVVDVQSGATRALSQGPDAESFGQDDCP